MDEAFLCVTLSVSPLCIYAENRTFAELDFLPAETFLIYTPRWTNACQKCPFSLHQFRVN